MTNLQKIAKAVVKQISQVMKVNEFALKVTYIQSSHNTIYVNDIKKFVEELNSIAASNYIYFDIEETDKYIHITVEHCGVKVFTLCVCQM